MTWVKPSASPAAPLDLAARTTCALRQGSARPQRHSCPRSSRKLVVRLKDALVVLGHGHVLKPVAGD